MERSSTLLHLSAAVAPIEYVEETVIDVLAVTATQ